MVNGTVAGSAVAVNYRSPSTAYRQACRIQNVVNKLGFQVKFFMGNILRVLVNTVVCAQTVDGVSLAKGSWTSCTLHTLAISLLHLSVACPEPEVWPSGRIQKALFYPCPSNKLRVSHPAFSKVTIVTTFLLHGAESFLRS